MAAKKSVLSLLLLFKYHLITFSPQHSPPTLFFCMDLQWKCVEEEEHRWRERGKKVFRLLKTCSKNCARTASERDSTMTKRMRGENPSHFYCWLLQHQRHSGERSINSHLNEQPLDSTHLTYEKVVIYFRFLSFFLHRLPFLDFSCPLPFFRPISVVSLVFMVLRLMYVCVSIFSTSLTPFYAFATLTPLLNVHTHTHTFFFSFLPASSTVRLCCFALLPFNWMCNCWKPTVIAFCIFRNMRYITGGYE